MQRFHDKKYNKHWIYLDDNNTPLILPCLYARYITQRGVYIELKVKKDRITNQIIHFFEEVETSFDGQYVRCNQLGLFLDWVCMQSLSGSQMSLTNHTALPSDVINGYINNYLIKTQGKSEVAVSKAVYSLKSYFNWLSYFFDNKYKNIFVFSSHRTLSRANNKQCLLVKYLLPATRELLYRRAGTLLEEIILRTGGDLGCRTKENQGFLLKDFTANQKKHSGLLSLFSELEKKADKHEFEYHLSSLYTKYGRSRTLYIPRLLLEKMQRYYSTERPITNSNNLFVSNANNYSKGCVLSSEYGSRTFHKVLLKVINSIDENPELYTGCQILERGAVYHHLRHSFGTDVFYEQCRNSGKNFETITTESATYIETARRMGHKVDGYSSNQTTKLYIHSCGYKERLLKMVVNGEQ